MYLCTDRHVCECISTCRPSLLFVCSSLSAVCVCVRIFSRKSTQRAGSSVGVSGRPESSPCLCLHIYSYMYVPICFREDAARPSTRADVYACRARRLFCVAGRACLRVWMDPRRSVSPCGYVGDLTCVLFGCFFSFFSYREKILPSSYLYFPLDFFTNFRGKRGPKTLVCGSFFSSFGV